MQKAEPELKAHIKYNVSASKSCVFRWSDVAPNAHFDESQEQLPEQSDNGKHLRLLEGDMDIFGPVRRMRRRSM